MNFNEDEKILEVIEEREKNDNGIRHSISDLELLAKDIENSSVEIRLYNHKTNKVLYENLNMGQLEHILKVLDPKGWQ